MKKILLGLVSSLLISQAAYSSCQVGDYSFKVVVTDQTFSDSYDYDAVSMVDGDFALVTNAKTGEEYKFDLGFFENDGAGNFSMDAISSQDATAFSVYHDHETWHEQLEGYFTLPDNKIIDLDTVNDCDFDSLFEVN